MSKVKAISKAPCAHCPFRKDVPIFLRADRRREIAKALINGESFPCHETTVSYEDETGEDHMAAHLDSVECAGAAKALMLLDGTTQMMRIAERLGLADLDEVARRGAEVWDLSTWVKLSEGATGDEVWTEEIETCGTVKEGCLAPAGFLGASGAILEGSVSADGTCTLCEEPLCSNCADDEGLCSMCIEEEEDDGTW